METDRLKQFQVLYKVGNLRKASELIGISHSGLSKSMNTLEIELNQKLYFQSGRKIVFTDQAHDLALQIPTFLGQLEKLMFFDKKESKKSLKIGSFEVFSTYFSKSLAPLLDNYILDFHELFPGKMEKALLQREIDLAITYEPIPMEGVEYIKATQIEMGAFVRKGTFLKTNILEIPFAAPAIPIEGAPSNIKGLDSWPDNKFPRNILFRVDLMETGLSLTRNGLCAIFIPTFVAKLHNEVVKEKFKLVQKNLPRKMKKVTRDVYIVKREGTLDSDKIKDLKNILSQI